MNTIRKTFHRITCPGFSIFFEKKFSYLSEKNNKLIKFNLSIAK
jgi:hypothetical protein